MANIITAIVTPVLTGLIVWFIERNRTKRDELREEAEAINAEVNVASMELAYATAMAVKRGKANGEVEKAVESYNTAKKHLDQFNQKLQSKVIK